MNQKNMQAYEKITPIMNQMISIITNYLKKTVAYVSGIRVSIEGYYVR